LVNRLLRGSDYTITNERIAAVDAFLSWLRANAIRHQDRIRIVLTGSIGLEPLVRQAGISATLNVFTPFHLEPWTRDVAGGCLRALASNYNLILSASVIQQMLDHLGVYIPHHVQMFFDHVYQRARIAGLQEVPAGLVNEVYQHSMLGVRGHVELSHMEERLRTVLGPNLDSLALDLLTEAAVTGSLGADTARALAVEHFGLEWATPLRDVLGILEHDGYLTNKTGRYSFASSLLKDWWRARFQFAHIPATARGK
jgi:hypothetical protein